MGNFERQLSNALRRIHRQIRGSDGVCRWYYSSKRNIYHCPHTAIYGKDLMLQIPGWREFNERTEAKVEWDRSPESEHTL